MNVPDTPWYACSYHQHVAISKVSVKTSQDHSVTPMFFHLQKIIFKHLFWLENVLSPMFVFGPDEAAKRIGRNLAPWYHNNGRHWQSSPPLRSSQMGTKRKERRSASLALLFFSPFFFGISEFPPKKKSESMGDHWYSLISFNKAPIWVSLTAWSHDQSNPCDLPCGEIFLKIAQQVSVSRPKTPSK